MVYRNFIIFACTSFSNDYCLKCTILRPWFLPCRCGGLTSPILRQRYILQIQHARWNGHAMSPPLKSIVCSTGGWVESQLFILYLLCAKKKQSFSRVNINNLQTVPGCVVPPDGDRWLFATVLYIPPRRYDCILWTVLLFILYGMKGWKHIPLSVLTPLPYFAVLGFHRLIRVTCPSLYGQGPYILYFIVSSLSYRLSLYSTNGAFPKDAHDLLGSFSANSPICLYYSFVFPGTLVRPVVPGESTSFS